MIHSPIAAPLTTVLLKTVSEACNLACDYCYYSKCENKSTIQTFDLDVLEKFIKEYSSYSNGFMTFVWQGGEPLLAGLPFFEKVIELQKKYGKNGSIISNSLQTNATLITKEWADFFKEYNFLIGVSIDGPKEIHNKRRPNRGGQGSFAQVMRGISHLKAAGVEFNILTVVHEDNVLKGQELMAFYKEEDFRYIQFIPCMDFQSQDIDAPGKFLITPKEYGKFLCDVFDVWFNDGSPETSIRFFDEYLSVSLHQQAALCTHRKTCPKTLILESNGDAYPCDFYITEDLRLGNIGEDSLTDILSSPIYNTFLTKKEDLAERCLDCEFLSFCHGGCPRNRNWTEDANYDYFCESFKIIYQYSSDRMNRLTRTIKSQWKQQLIREGHPLPDRNSLCFCGSGKKYKKCCALLTV
ncbi:MULTISPECIES: anaerobic sulfatase maturase [Niallia]|uniref:Anaerobic sulfatase maturase n=1 Tax=Niallia circulans TaxID=1397 RepID=A0A268FD43_NIACI|nr:anaerobic sulfatase maturase [Niallia circulans]AYV69671.1 anaerobic sulfatase maturase [Niallia circulans]NRG26157.1 anaerobic sulfatase maturase [Niallia circulans]PAD83281.1 anaerobic sulfatase maturase [Niallia circulans]QJX61158.1 anaerobic sulfatase maturase [Niallia circulans]